LEDPIPLEHYDRLAELRAAAPMPIAVGEQVSSVTDAARLVTGGGVDLLRLHVPDRAAPCSSGGRCAYAVPTAG
jgi:mannonate dehydratase